MNGIPTQRKLIAIKLKRLHKTVDEMDEAPPDRCMTYNVSKLLSLTLGLRNTFVERNLFSSVDH